MDLNYAEFSISLVSVLSMSVKIKSDLIVKRKNEFFICGFATLEICIFASLDEINVILIPKI